MAASALIYLHLEKSWSVQSITTIVEPKKVYGEVYKRGDIVQARFSGSTYPGLVVHVSTNRENLKSVGAIVDKITSRHGPGDLLPEEMLLALKIEETISTTGKAIANEGKTAKSTLTPKTGLNTSSTKSKDDTKKRNNSNRQKRLEAAAANLELTELSAEVERSSEAATGRISPPSTFANTPLYSSSTSSLVGESLKLVTHTEDQNLNQQYRQTAAPPFNICQQMEKDLAQINLRNLSLEAKVAQLQNNISSLWSWTSQFQQEMRSMQDDSSNKRLKSSLIHVAMLV